jgi:proteasome lid subunit RPN8/RPN11
MEIHSEKDLALWTTPECPFPIEYSTRVLDDIRLIVTDAFFSLPRGGAEIGGLLLGRHEKGRVTILDSVQLDCEHAFGPSFVLSPRDFAKLTDLVAAAKKTRQALPVGWYHSHTRSEIFLSDADREIHSRFFPEPWQVALVLKPHTFQPMRAGFFFREKDGSMQGASAYKEFLLQPLPIRPLPSGSPPPSPTPFSAAHEPETNGRIINVESVVEPDIPPPQPEAARPEPPAPAFLTPEPAPPRRWVGWAAVGLGVALGVAAFETRDAWLPRAQALFQAAPADSPSLNAVDRNGQLQFQWNPAATAVRAATAGSLLIVDGTIPVTVPLDAAHLQSGSLTYTRRSGHVDATLILPQPGGKEVRQATLFTGNAPEHPTAATAPPPAAAPASGDDSGIRAERDALAKQNAGLKIALAKEVEHTKLLEKGLEELRKVVREDQRKRLEHMAPDSAK